MVEQLWAAGWRPWKKHNTIWQAPTGGIWRGPALAWHVMNNLPWPPNAEWSDGGQPPAEQHKG